MPDKGRATRAVAVLDHVAVGTRSLGDGWALFGGVLGGAWAYGGDSPGFWWGQLQFAAGPKVELLTPTGGPDAAFLERFLAARGPGVHHLNFIVPAIEVTLGKVRALGIEPVRVNLQDPSWKEAFLRPVDGYGTVVQIAEQAGTPPSSSPPPELGEPGEPCALAWIEQHVADIDGAIRLFEGALDGEVVSRQDADGHLVAELCWQNQARLRLVQPAAAGEGGLPHGDGIAQVRFSRDEGTFGPEELQRATVLSRRLGVPVQLGT